MSSAHETLERLKACPEAVGWVGDRSPEAAWQECERGDWLLWVSAKIDVPRPLVVLAACGCARLALRYVPEGEDRLRVAIETAEAWARGGPDAPSLDAVRDTADAANAANAAAYYAAADAATYAANAAAYYAANAAAYAPADVVATAAADAAANAVNARPRGAARRETLKTCADIVRRNIPFAAITEALFANQKRES